MAKVTVDVSKLVERLLNEARREDDISTGGPIPNKEEAEFRRNYYCDVYDKYRRLKASGAVLVEM